MDGIFKECLSNTHTLSVMPRVSILSINERLHENMQHYTWLVVWKPALWAQ
jgi:hypothetical protein